MSFCVYSLSHSWTDLNSFLSLKEAMESKISRQVLLKNEKKSLVEKSELKALENADKKHSEKFEIVKKRKARMQAGG